MAPNEPDKVQREIEELLGKLDTFVPEERLASKIKGRRKAEAGPGLTERLLKRVSHVTLGHVMVTGLALLLVASFAPGLFGGYSRYALILGLLLTGAAFVMSVIGWDSQRTITGGTSVKRWRGQIIDYSQPSTPSRIRDWLRGKRRR